MYLTGNKKVSRYMMRYKVQREPSRIRSLRFTLLTEILSKSERIMINQEEKLSSYKGILIKQMMSRRDNNRIFINLRMILDSKKKKMGMPIISWLYLRRNQEISMTDLPVSMRPLIRDQFKLRRQFTN